MTPGEPTGGADDEPVPVASLISFTVETVSGGSVAFNAENGMSWEDWINSDYNTGGYSTTRLAGDFGYDTGIKTAGGTTIYLDYALNTPVNAANAIIDDGTYYIRHTGGEN